MNRWPLLAVVTVLASLAGTYAFYARNNQLNAGSLRSAEAELDVEEFDSEDVSEEDAEALQGATTGDAVKNARNQPSTRWSAKSSDPSQVETIEDEDMMGETVEEPLVIDDEDENGTLELATPGSSTRAGTDAAINERP